MDIKEKQARWAIERPLFEAEFIHSHLLPFFKFNENTGDYEIISECVNNTDDEDRKVAYETLNTGWVMWLRAKRDAKAQAVPEQDQQIWATCDLTWKDVAFRTLSCKVLKTTQNWVHVKNIVCVGSTTASLICTKLGVNPDGTKFDLIKPQEST